MKRFAFALTVLVLAGCSNDEGRQLGVIEARLTAAERAARLTQIRDAAASAGLRNGVLLAGIAQAETGLAHCWSEAMWACEGPASADCGGGGVIAGAADGPCSSRAGGLGMFQFDAGDYDQTLAREGTRILSVAGNVEAAIDFVVAMVIRSVYVPGVDTREQALAWMETVVVGGTNSTEWIQTVTHYYNGCTPTGCSVYDDRIRSYTNALTTVHDEMGADFWSMSMPAPCEAIPAAGRVLDDTDACVFLGGDRRYWRSETDAGYGGSLRWTNATASAAPSNYATWTLRFAQDGDYELFVHTDAAYAESRMAPYTITSLDGPQERIVDQSAAALQSLGVFSFETGTDYEVRVDDDTGEPVGDMMAIVVDALEARAVAIPEVDAGIIGGDASVPMEDASIATDAGTSRPTPSNGCACGVARSRGLGGPLVALAVLAALAVVRRRRRE